MSRPPTPTIRPGPNHLLAQATRMMRAQGQHVAVDRATTYALTSFHEAAHAVAAVALRQRLARVTVVPTDDALGECHLRDGHPATDADALRDGPALVVVMLAGPMAERRFVDLRWDAVASTGDVSAVAAMTMCLARAWGTRLILLDAMPPEARDDARGQRAIIHAAMVDTYALVDGMWPAIRVVARELLTRRELSGTCVQRLVRAHGGVPSGLTPDCVRSRLYRAHDAALLHRPV